MTPRGAAILALVGLAAVMAGLVVFAVPWSVAAPSRAAQLAAVADLPADQVAKGKEFHSALRPSGYAGLLLGLAVALALGLTPLGARLIELAGRPLGGHWLAQALLGGLAVVLIGQLVALPFAAWRHVVLRRYDLSTQDWSGWAVDVAKSLLVTGVLAVVVLAGFYTLTRLAPRWWWAFAAAGAAGLVLLLSLVFPLLVEPIFNKFTPMPESPLRAELMNLAARDGVPVRDVLVADASRRTRTVNAYVSGYGPTRRIVVYDTLLEAGSDTEVAQVVAHELGHAKDRDVVIGTVLGSAGAAAAVCALYLLGGWGWLLRRAGLPGEPSDLADPRALALLLAVVSLAGLLTTPAQSLVSRQIEMRADRHALELTGDPAGFEAMQRRLALRNLSDPDPPRLEHWWFGSHPTTGQRIAAARAHGE
ncbi:MAG: M48 family metalloprotease [Micromonosporaceae bacterium]|nr:M48 family metalloprotease [Micromonosporaceae bacterium]